MKSLKTCQDQGSATGHDINLGSLRTPTAPPSRADSLAWQLGVSDGKSPPNCYENPGKLVMINYQIWGYPIFRQTKVANENRSSWSIMKHGNLPRPHQLWPLLLGHQSAIALQKLCLRSRIEAVASADAEKQHRFPQCKIAISSLKMVFSSW